MKGKMAEILDIDEALRKRPFLIMPGYYSDLGLACNFAQNGVSRPIWRGA